MRWSPMPSTTCDVTAVPLPRSNPAVRRFSVSDSSNAFYSSPRHKNKEGGKPVQLSHCWMRSQCCIFKLSKSEFKFYLGFSVRKTDWIRKGVNPWTSQTWLKDEEFPVQKSLRSSIILLFPSMSGDCVPP